MMRASNQCRKPCTIAEIILFMLIVMDLARAGEGNAELNEFATDVSEISTHLERKWEIRSRQYDACPPGWLCSRPAGTILTLRLKDKPVDVEVFIVPRAWVGFEISKTWRSKWPVFETFVGPRLRAIVGRLKSDGESHLSLLKTLIEHDALQGRVVTIDAGLWKRRKEECKFNDAELERIKKYIADSEVEKKHTPDEIASIAESCQEYGLPCLGIFEQALKSGRTEARRRAILALSCIYREGFIPELKRLLADENNVIAKTAALQLLLAYDDQTLAKELLDMLTNKAVNKVTNEYIIDIIGNARLNSAHGKILEILETTNDEGETSACIRALGIFGSRNDLIKIIAAGRKYRLIEDQGCLGAAIERLSKKWGDPAGGFRLNLEVSKWYVRTGEKVRVKVLMDPIGCLRDSWDCKPRPDIFSITILVDGQLERWKLPAGIFEYEKIPEIEEIGSDAPEVLTATPGTKEIHARLGEAVSNPVFIVVR